MHQQPASAGLEAWPRQAPLTGMSTTDFVPADGMEAVSAEDLGMTGEYTAGFALSVDKSGSSRPKCNFPASSLSDVRVTRQGKPPPWMNRTG